MRYRSQRRAGITLVELVVVMLIIGLSLTVVAMAARGEPEVNAGESPDDLLLKARRQAIRSGREHQLRVRITPEREVIALDDAQPGSRVVFAIARPDGSVVGDPEISR
jgi:type II secretory pathway pseudopilin PulG